MTSIEELETQAKRLSQRGDAAGTERICREILDQRADHLPSLRFLSDHAFQRGDLALAETYLRRGLDLSPAEERLHSQLGQILYRQGRFEEAVGAYQDYWRLNPRNAMLYLALGCLHVEMGEIDRAAQVFSLGESVDSGLLSIWQRADASPAIKTMSRTGHDTLCRHHTAMHLDAIDSMTQAGAAQRIRDAVWPLLDERDIDYAHDRQRAQVFYVRYPEAPPFFEREELPWCAGLERKFEEIREEILSGLNLEADGRPYLRDGHKLEGEQWEAVVNKMNWASVHLYSQGVANRSVFEKFPKTLAALEDVPLATFRGNPAEVFISVLAPGIRIPEHYGVSSAILTVHLPILVPDGCGLVAGDETRVPEEGKVLAFDDTWEHSAWNMGSTQRVVLIFEIWYPQLTEVEREAVLRSFRARQDWLASRSVL
jgi:tetratricopeptide (TPR) repeat protein